MYVPKEFSAKNEQQIDAFISDHPFATMITNSEDEFPIATHIPVIAKKTNDIWNLEGHIALANQQHLSILKESKALFTLLGAHGYISSSVYSAENVPTWNYEAVHLYGQLNLLSDEGLDQHLNELVAFFEDKREIPLKYGSFSPKMINSYKKEIVGFRLEVSKIEAAFKLSQNRSDIDIDAIVKDLSKCPMHGDLAKVMLSEKNGDGG